jgi:hypothetical protein
MLFFSSFRLRSGGKKGKKTIAFGERASDGRPSGVGPQQHVDIIIKKPKNRSILTLRRPFLGAKWGF